MTETEDHPTGSGGETGPVGPAPRSRLWPRRRRVRGWRAVVLGAEVLVLLVLLPVIVIGLAVMLASDDRVRLPAVLETRLEAAIDATVPGFDVVLRAVDVTLPETGFTPQIALQGVELRDADGLRAFLPEVTVVVNGWALTRGEFRPRLVRFDGAGLRLVRDAAGVIDLSAATGATEGGGGITETLERLDRLMAQPDFSELSEVSGQDLVLLLSDERSGQLIQSQNAQMSLSRDGSALTLRVVGSVMASRAAQVDLALTYDAEAGQNTIGLGFEDLATADLASASPALQWLDVLQAPISGRLNGAVTADGRLGDMSGVLEVGAGQFRPGADQDPVPVDRVRAAIAFDAETGQLAFEDLIVRAAPLSFAATGRAEVSPSGDVIVGQLQFSGIEADPEGLFAQPLVFEGGALDLRLTLRPDFDLQIGQAVLHDGPLRLRGWGQITADETGLSSRIDLRLPERSMTALYPYWPGFLAPTTRAWVTENLRAGEMRNFAASYRSGPGTAQLAMRFDFEALQLQPLRDYPLIDQASGYLSVVNRELVLHLTEAGMTAPQGGRVDVSGSTMVIRELQGDRSEVRFDLAVDGPLPAVGSVLALPPVNLLQDSALDPADLAMGRAEAEVGLDVIFGPRRPGDRVGFEARGTLRDVVSTSLVPGRRLSAQALDLQLSQTDLVIAGRAELDGVPITGRWQQGFSETDGPVLQGRAGLSADHLARLGVPLPDGLLTGAGGADFTLTLPQGRPPELLIRSDMAGLGMQVPGLPWALAEDETGRLSARVVLGAAPRVPELELSAAGGQFRGAVNVAPSGAFQSLEILEARLGDWTDVTGVLTPGRLSLEGGRLDLRALQEGVGPQSGGLSTGLAITARLNELILTDSIALTEFNADLAPGLTGPIFGLVNGRAGLSGRLTRTGDGLAMDFAAGDAGAILRAAALFQDAYGGQMQMALRPTGAAGSFDGQVYITGIRLRDAPAMAELLNAISVVGLLEQLGNEGINLGDLEAGFRIRPGLVILDEGTALGNAMGLSMSGVYETGPASYQMQGVISPIYVLNGLAGALFAPSREGLFGFTYELEGNARDGAVVRVNPLSILTPGIFREIFRAPPPEIPENRSAP